MTPAVLVGQGIGDALGMPFETLNEDVHPQLKGWGGSFQAGNFHKLPAGHWTDDTEMAVCLARSLFECGAYLPSDAAKRYLEWIRGTPHGAGGTTKAAMKLLAEGKTWEESGQTFDDPNKVGSGPAMRAAPIGAYFLSTPKIWEACRRDAIITHRNPEAVVSSFVVAMATRRALEAFVPVAILRSVLDEIENLCPRDTLVEKGLRECLRSLLDGRKHPGLLADEKLGRRGNAWQISTTAIYCALYYDNFRDGVTNAVRLGGDADTRGAIAGAILGARFGLEGIPEEYKRGVLDFDTLKSYDRQVTFPDASHR
jgi:ADP-ribosyl-[dinitrogen reductase] hydrolase